MQDIKAVQCRTAQGTKILEILSLDLSPGIEAAVCQQLGVAARSEYFDVLPAKQLIRCVIQHCCPLGGQLQSFDCHGV